MKNLTKPESSILRLALSIARDKLIEAKHLYIREGSAKITTFNKSDYNDLAIKLDEPKRIDTTHKGEVTYNTANYRMTPEQVDEHNTSEVRYGNTLRFHSEVVAVHYGDDSTVVVCRTWKEEV